MSVQIKKLHFVWCAVLSSTLLFGVFTNAQDDSIESPMTINDSPTVLNMTDIMSPMTEYGTFRKGRWGIFFTFEPICSLACRKNGKYSGRMYGGVCRCYCPRIETAPCSGSYPSCDRLCRKNNYHLGGDCIDGQSCWCFCTVRQRQAPNSTITTTTLAPCANASTSSIAPSAQGVAFTPSKKKRIFSLVP